LLLKRQKEEQEFKLLSSVTSPERCTELEKRLLLKLLTNGFRPEEIYFDIYFEDNLERFKRVQLVLTTSVGLIVVWLQVCSGLVYAKKHRDVWVQKQDTGEMVKILNPIKHNQDCIDTVINNLVVSDLPKSLKYQETKVYSVVALCGDFEVDGIKLDQDMDNQNPTPDTPPVEQTDFLIRDWQVLEALQFITHNHEPSTIEHDKLVHTILQQAKDNGKEQEIVLDHLKQTHDNFHKYLVK